MRVTIEIDYAQSTLRAPREVVAVVQRYVSYQEAERAPVAVQVALRALFEDQPRNGGPQDVWAAWRAPSVRAAMGATGFDLHALTPQMIDAACTSQGYWDGWTSPVTAGGVFPTGLLAHVRRILRYRCGVDPQYDDRRDAPPQPRPLKPPPPLFGYQAEAVAAFFAAGQGVIDLPPRTGKTRIAVAIVAASGFPTLFVAPNKGLARQSVAAFAEHFGDHAVGYLVNGATGAKLRRRMPHQLVWVATPQTAAGLPGLASRHLLILDEFHHAAASTWQTVSKRANRAWWRLGLTGTHYRADGQDMAMAGVLGQAVYSRSVTDMVALGRVVPARIAMLRVDGPPGEGRTWHRKGIVESEPRNRTLVWAANQLVATGRRVLCLVQQIEHGQQLVSQIPGSVFVSGASGDQTDAALAALERREVTAVIGTGVIGEGRDVPAADALVYFAGGKSEVRHTQDYYRVLTASPGKRFGVIVDAADQHGVLHKHAAERLRHYRSEPCFESVVLDWEAFPGWLATL